MRKNRGDHLCFVLETSSKNFGDSWCFIFERAFVVFVFFIECEKILRSSCILFLKVYGQILRIRSVFLFRICKSLDGSSVWFLKEFERVLEAPSIFLKNVKES